MTPNTGIKNDYLSNSQVSSSDLNRRAGLLDTQPQGALRALGAGVIQNSAGTSLQVTPGVGLNVSVAAGEAIILSSGTNGLAIHPVWGRSNAPATVDCSAYEAAEPFYIHVRLLVAASAGDPDTELGTAGIQPFASDSNSVPGALRLADCTHDNSAVTVTPANLYTRLDKVIRDLAAETAVVTQIQSDLGYSDDERDKGTVAERLDVLETGGGEGGGGGGGDGGGSSIVYLEQLKDRSADPRNAIVVRDELLANLRSDLEAEIAAGGRIPVTSQTGLLYRNQALLIHQSAEVHPHNVEDFQGAFVGKGQYGDGTADTENHVLINTMNETDRGWTPS